MRTRLVSRALLAVLLAATGACSAELPTATSVSATPDLRRGDRPPALAVAGLWDGQYPIPGRPNATREWTLNLVQRDEKLEGSLTSTITTEEGQTFQSTSSLASGSVIGRTVTVVFPTGEGAETKPGSPERKATAAR